MEKALTLRLESVDKAIREYEDPTSDVGLKRAEKDPRLAKIKELRRTLAGMQSMYKETYPDVAHVRDELKRLQAMTTEDYIALYVEQEPADVDGGTRKRKVVDPYKMELLKQREDIQREFELLRHRQARIAAEVKKYEGRIDQTAVHQQTLMTMQRDYENLQKNYQTLLEKKLSVGIAGDLEKKQQGTQLRIIDPAKLPVWPEKPNVLMIMFGGLAIGCALGFGSAFGLEILRRGFVTAEEIEMTLGLPVLAAISQFESAWPKAGKASSGQSRPQEGLLSLASLNQDGLLSSNGAQVSVGPEVVAMWYPRSVVAEQYRVAATRLGLMVNKQKGIVVVVASAIMGEGKTSTALNLAHVLARDLNRKTVLVDCDLKRPMVQAYAGMESTAGVSEVLLGNKTVEECLQYHEQLRIWVLPEGSEPSGTAALAHVDRLSELIESLRARFDYVVIDSPPLLPVAEAMLIVRMADVVTHVIRARSTPRDVVANAIKMIGQEKAVAVVLNAVEAKDAPYSYYTYSQRAYEPHRKRIG
jgi:capsular exopolysaccharide synthesis family protein